MKFNKKKIWDAVKEPLYIAGAGTLANTVVDAALQAAEAVIPENITKGEYSTYWINGGKLALGAVITTVGAKYKIAQLAGIGLSTVGASNLANAALEAIMPDAAGKEGAGGVPFIGKPRRVRMGQRSFRNVRPAVRGTGKIGAVPFQAE